MIDGESPIFLSFSEYKSNGIGPKLVSLMFAFEPHGALFYNLLDQEKYGNYSLPEYVYGIDFHLILQIHDGNKTYWKKDVILSIDTNREMIWYEGTLCSTILHLPVLNLWLSYEIYYD